MSKWEKISFLLVIFDTYDVVYNCSISLLPYIILDILFMIFSNNVDVMLEKKTINKRNTQKILNLNKKAYYVLFCNNIFFRIPDTLIYLILGKYLK